MNALNVLIIEDDLFWQFKLQRMVKELNLGTLFLASSVAEAQRVLDNKLPDLVIADIVLQDGFSLSLFTKSYAKLPVIFQTGYTKEEFLKKVTSLTNVGFLVKPFERFSLQAAIEVLFARITPKASPPLNAITVVGKHKQRIQIPLEGIYWIKTEGNYSIINTIDQKYVLKKSLRKLANDLTGQFIQVQKGYIINSNYIERIGDSIVQLNHQSIPIGRKYRKHLIQKVTDLTTRGLA